jgi:putative transposase
MPDHIHLILTPAQDVSLEKAIQYIKGGFSFLLKSKFDVWEQGKNESQIRTHEKFKACKTYIEENPVRKRIVERADLYPFSSAGKRDLVDGCPPWLAQEARG